MIIQNYNIVETRNGCLYLYIKRNSTSWMYALSNDSIREFEKRWDQNLLAKRNGVWKHSRDYTDESEYDIVAIYAITDELEFLNLIRMVRFISKDSLLHGTPKECCKCIWNRKLENEWIPISTGVFPEDREIVQVTYSASSDKRPYCDAFAYREGNNWKWAEDDELVFESITAWKYNCNPYTET